MRPEMKHSRNEIYFRYEKNTLKTKRKEISILEATMQEFIEEISP